MPARNTSEGRPGPRTRAAQQSRQRQAPPAESPRRERAQAPARTRRPVEVEETPARRGAQRKDVTAYATQEPTDFHKAFAQWIVREVGYKPSQAASAKEAFLMGVSIATAARPKFMQSEFLEEWREKTGTTKRGPKPQPEPVEADEDDDDFDDTDDDDDFDDDDDATDEDDDDWEDDDDADDEPEPVPPVKRGPGRPRKAATAPVKAAPVKAQGRPASKATRTKPATEDDFVF
jgi:hypothetical protein